tara:strand:+ start:1418 stop:1654 length:237 start_codon:yes stop_codon:yes gene_type:complete
VSIEKIFKIGDIVTEEELIVPPDRSRWNGIVISIEKDAWVFTTIKNPETQDRITVLWLDNGITEELPASVLLLWYSTN